MPIEDLQACPYSFPGVWYRRALYISALRKYDVIVGADLFYLLADAGHPRPLFGRVVCARYLSSDLLI